MTVTLLPPATAFKMSDPRVHLDYEVEPFITSLKGEDSMHMTPSVEINIAYDLGHAREALRDLQFAAKRLEVKLNAAISGENSARRDRIESTIPGVSNA